MILFQSQRDASQLLPEVEAPFKYSKQQETGISVRQPQEDGLHCVLFFCQVSNGLGWKSKQIFHPEASVQFLNCAYLKEVLQ